MPTVVGQLHGLTIGKHLDVDLTDSGETGGVATKEGNHAAVGRNSGRKNRIAEIGELRVARRCPEGLSGSASAEPSHQHYNCSSGKTYDQPNNLDRRRLRASVADLLSGGLG